MSSMLNTFIIPVVRQDLLPRCLETLYKYTEPNFYVFVIDQTIDGLNPNHRDTYPNLMIIRTPKTETHKLGNLGHSQATNLGIRLAQTPYVTFLNDDVEFVHSGWWQGILDTFTKVREATPHRPAMLINAASIKLPDWSVGKPQGEDHYILPYKENYGDEDWDFLVKDSHYVNEHLTIEPGSVIDGINLYCSVADREKLLEVGLLDEYWYPGMANDYDLSCRASMLGYRCVGTTLSWVFHHWSKTFNGVMPVGFMDEALRHGDLRDKWGSQFDLWGVKCSECDGILQATKGATVAICPDHSNQAFRLPKLTEVEL